VLASGGAKGISYPYVSDQGSLNKASKRLLKELRRQWIVWVEGRHLPSDIELGPEVQGIRLAG
jgi:hypothetical protein